MNTIIIIWLLMELTIPKSLFKPHGKTGNIKVFKSQQLFLNSNHYETLFFGGMGSGKTEALIAKGIVESIAYKENSGIIAARSFSVLERGAKYKFFQMLGRTGLDKHFKFNNKFKIGFFDNGSRVTFVHCQHPEDLKGSDEGWVAIDELTSIRKDSYDNLFTRTRLHDNAKNFTASNTADPMHWCFKKYIKGHEKEYEKNNRFVVKDEHTDRLIIRALTFENTNLPERYRLVESGLSENDRLKFIQALWTAPVGLVYGSCFDIKRNILSDPQIKQLKWQVSTDKESWQYIISLDPSYHNFAIGHYLINQQYQFVNKIRDQRFNELETSDIAKHLVDEINTIEQDYEIKLSYGYIDPSQQQASIDVTQALRKYNKQIYMMNANNDVDNGIITLRRFFKTGQFKFYEDHCQYTKEERESYRFKYDQRADLYLDKPDKQHFDPHSLDETRYLIHSLFGLRVIGGNVEYQQFDKRIYHEEIEDERHF